MNSNTGTLTLPNGDRVLVERRNNRVVYHCPPPWKPGTWFRVPNDKLKDIEWETA